MKKSIKALLLAAIAGAALVALCACQSSFSYTFEVATGDDIEVTLNTSDGFDLVTTEDTGVDFAVSYDDAQVLTGMFVYAEAVPEIEGMIAGSGYTEAEGLAVEGATGKAFTLQNGDTTQAVVILTVDGTNTGIVLESTAATDDPIAAANLLSFAPASE